MRSMVEGANDNLDPDVEARAAFPQNAHPAHPILSARRSQ
jgi:hypothetical protein